MYKRQARGSVIFDRHRSERYKSCTGLRISSQTLLCNFGVLREETSSTPLCSSLLFSDFLGLLLIHQLQNMPSDRGVVSTSRLLPYEHNSATVISLALGTNSTTTINTVYYINTASTPTANSTTTETIRLRLRRLVLYSCYS